LPQYSGVPHDEWLGKTFIPFAHWLYKDIHKSRCGRRYTVTLIRLNRCSKEEIIDATIVGEAGQKCSELRITEAGE
jgi:hypothetical protein